MFFSLAAALSDTALEEDDCIILTLDDATIAEVFEVMQISIGYFTLAGNYSSSRYSICSYTQC